MEIGMLGFSFFFIFTHLLLSDSYLFKWLTVVQPSWHPWKDGEIDDEMP